MDDIADVAGVSKPVLYQHFSSKLELYLALVDQSCQRLIEVVAEAMKSSDDNAIRVKATTEAFFAFVSSERSDYRFIFESDLTGEPDVQQRIRQVIEFVSDKVAEMIMTDAGLQPAQAKLLGIALVGLAQVSARYWDSEGREIAVEEATHLVSSLVWRGISDFPRVDHLPAAQSS